MSELHIRINKRTFERTLFTVIILGLAAWLFIALNDGGAAADVDVSAYEERIATLESQNADLSRELNTTREALVNATSAPEAEEPAAEEQEALSGAIDVSMSVRLNRVNPERVDDITLAIDNGLATAQQITYIAYYDGYEDTMVKARDTLSVQSGRSMAHQILSDGTGELPSYIPSDSDSVIIEVRDSDGNLLERLAEDLR